MILTSIKSRIIVAILSVVIISLSVSTYYQVIEAKKAIASRIEEKALSVTQITRDYIKFRHNAIIADSVNKLNLKKKSIRSKVDALHRMFAANANNKDIVIDNLTNMQVGALRDLSQLSTFDSQVLLWVGKLYDLKTNDGRGNGSVYGHKTASFVYDINNSYKRARNCTGINGNNVFAIADNLLQDASEGFIECGIVEQSGAEERQINHTIFIKKFMPWGWYIALSTPTNDVEADINNSITVLINEIKNILEKQKIGKTGYFFIFRGDGYMPLHPTIQGENATKIINPDSGNSIIYDLKGAARTERRALSYLWDRPTDKGNYIYRKSAFVSHYPALDWYISSSIYVDDMNLFVAPFIQKALLSFVIFIAIATGVSLFLAKATTRPLRKLVQYVSNVDEKGIPVGDLPEEQSDEGAVLINSMEKMITSIKQYQVSFLESESKFRALVESLNDILFEFDITGNISFISPQVNELLGYVQDEVVGQKPGFLLHDENYERSLNLIKHMFIGQDEIHNEVFNFKDKDGAKRTFELSAGPFFDETGEFGGIRGVARDITIKTELDQALRETEERFKVLADQLILGTLIVQKGKIIYCNEAVLKIFEMEIRDLEQLNQYELFKFIHPEDRSLIANQLMKKEKGITKGIITNNEWRAVKGSGEIGWVESWAKTVYLHGEPANFILIHDITQKKKAEEGIKQYRNYITSIIDSMPFMLVGINVDGEISLWNKTAIDKTGIDFNTANGRHLNDVLPDMSAQAVEIEKSIQNQEPIKSKRSYLGEKGNVVEEITVYPLSTEGFEGAVILIDDISDEVKIEEMMIQNEKMSSIAGLAAGMAHEINNPLAGMMQTASVLANRLVNNFDMQANQLAAKSCNTNVEAVKCFMEARDIPRMLGQIVESGNRAANIVNSMLSFSRNVNDSISSVDIIELIELTVKVAEADYNLKKNYDFKQIKIDRDYQENIPYIYCQQTKIQQVLFNLLRNSAQALHANNTSTPTISIKVYLEGYSEDDQRVVIELEDNGPGIPENIQNRIFEPFYTTKPVGEGTGLGLSVSYFIVVDQHGGDMQVFSAKEKGAKFRFSLPLIAKSSDLNQEKSSDKKS